MNNSMEKLEKVRAEIESDSMKEAETLVSEAKKKAEESISSTKESLKAKFDSEIARTTENFRASEKKRVSGTRSYEDRKNLVYRGELIDRFFGELEEELRKTAASPGYGDYLRRCVEKARDYFPLHAKITAYCRGEDVSAVKGALRAFRYDVEETKDIRVGGIILRCEGQSASVDFTFDTALEQEREKFASMKELQL